MRHSTRRWDHETRTQKFPSDFIGQTQIQIPTQHSGLSVIPVDLIDSDFCLSQPKPIDLPWKSYPTRSLLTRLALLAGVKCMQDEVPTATLGLPQGASRTIKQNTPWRDAPCSQVEDPWGLEPPRAANGKAMLPDPSFTWPRRKNRPLQPRFWERSGN